jgi:hypothetical protein
MHSIHPKVVGEIKAPGDDFGSVGPVNADKEYSPGPMNQGEVCPGHFNLGKGLK